jgi:cytochrome b
MTSTMTDTRTPSVRALHPCRVWDLEVRVFHWLNVLCVLGLTALGTAILWDKELGVSPDGKVLLKTVHVWLGYGLAANLAWRLVWAFIGTPFARWGAFLPRLRGLGPYVAGFLRGEAPRYLGHNPLGRLMVTALLLVLSAQAVTGLVLAGTDIYYPPLGSRIAAWVAAPGIDPASLVPGDQSQVDPAAWKAMRAVRSPVVETHEVLFFVLLALTVLHIAGVILAEVREGGSLVSAMFTGRKTLDQPPVDAPGGD